MAANAAAAAPGDQMELELQVAPGWLRVSLYDAADAMPDLAAALPSLTAESGRGCFLIGALSARARLEPAPRGHGKTIEVEVSLPASVAVAPSGRAAA